MIYFSEGVYELIKKLYFFPIIILSLILITGCGGGGGSNDADHPEIEQLLNKFENAVEAYRVSDINGNGMLDCLSGTNFTLRIEEAGLADDKTYDELKNELENDETNQTTWRKPASEGGRGYVLDLVLGTPSYSNATSSGAVVTQTFAVYESATGIPRMKTDNGAITWQVAQISGTWKVVAMTIEYQALSGSSLTVASTEKRSGLGFTTFGTRFK